MLSIFELIRNKTHEFSKLHELMESAHGNSSIYANKFLMRIYRRLLNCQNYVQYYYY